MGDIAGYSGIVTVVRACYLLSVVIILLVRLTPSLRDRFLQYGARETRQTGPATQADGQDQTPTTLLTRQLDKIAAVRVPHSAFWHFYAFSIACTSLSIVAVGLNLLAIGEERGDNSDSSGNSNGKLEVSTLARAALCLSLMGCQGIRRLWECISQSRGGPSTSSMWIGHYLIGMAFYACVNLGILAEHLRSLSVLGSTEAADGGVLLGRGLGVWVQTTAFAGFVAASWKQHVYHRYLASLKKYTLPAEGAFRIIVAPHYTAECVIYLALAILSAPAGGKFNVTILYALAFTIVNLGTTADGTKRWMLVKFSENRKEIERRWKMIPGLF
ncbi:hypothetical protein DV735_g2745, partial [Chaetothyriales sp. CBS 134920]